MPKRKALGPAENSDGEEDEYHSFPSTPIQSPYAKLVPNNNFHLPSSPKRISTLAGPPPMFSYGSSSQAPKIGQGSTQQQTKLPTFGMVNQSSPSVSITGVAKKPRVQEFSKSVKDLNSAFISSCRAAFSRNPSHSLIPIVKDYLYHSRVLMEQHRRGKESRELVNGINAPPKSFKTLGEFFDEFEQNYIEGKQDYSREEFGERTSRASGAFTNSDTSTLSSSTSEKSNSFSFNASSNKDNTKSPSLTSTSMAPFKLSTTSASSPLKTAMEANKSTSVTSFIPNPGSPLRPLHATSSTPAIPTSSSSKPAASDAANVTKPPSSAPFSGFSFFTTPSTTSTSTGLNTNPATTTASPAEEKNNDGEDGGDEDEPPKVELTPVTEDDAVYSKRCKVFGVVDGKCKDKGVGMLYVKKVEGEKYQIVVRADNNLGTVILNILLQKSLPLEKNSKNSIMTVDLQANNQKGMPIFLKVKSEADATELLAKLKQFQQSS